MWGSGVWGERCMGERCVGERCVRGRGVWGRGTVLERLAYDLDGICLQETRTRTEKPLELNDSLVVQKHDGRGMAIVIRKELQNTVSTVDLSQWCNNSRELQGIRLQKPEQRHKSLILINTYIHPSTASTKGSWEFL